MDVIELKGASGAAYRFRLWPPHEHRPPIAGNYVVIEQGGEGMVLSLIGITNDLAKAGPPARAGRPGGLIFTRLNVARATRKAEHEDLIAGQPKCDLADDDL